jgi:hypothetical protein
MVGVQLQRNKEPSYRGVGGVERLPAGLHFTVSLAAAMQAEFHRFIGHTGFKLRLECQILRTARHLASALQTLSQRKRTGDLQEAFRASLVSNPTPPSYPPAPTIS